MHVWRKLIRRLIVYHDDLLAVGGNYLVCLNRTKKYRQNARKNGILPRSNQKRNEKKTRSVYTGESKEDQNGRESFAGGDEKGSRGKKVGKMGIARLRIRLEIESPFAARYFGDIISEGYW